MRFELTTPTLARLCSTPELRPLVSARRLAPDDGGDVMDGGGFGKAVPCGLHDAAFLSM